MLKIHIFELRTDDLRNRTITDVKAAVRQIQQRQRDVK